MCRGTTRGANRTNCGCWDSNTDFFVKRRHANANRSTAHRALADCEAGLHLLAAVRLSRFGDKTAFAALLASARGGRIFFTADGSPHSANDFGQFGKIAIFEDQGFAESARYTIGIRRVAFGGAMWKRKTRRPSANGWKKISTPTARADRERKITPYARFTAKSGGIISESRVRLDEKSTGEIYSQSTTSVGRCLSANWR